jgi:hypothetical protein
MMKTEMFLETSVSFIHLMRLIAREDSIESCRRERFRSNKTALGLRPGENDFFSSVIKHDR